MREVIEIPKEQAVDSAGHLVPLSTEDGKYQGYKAAKIGDTYYALGRVINEAQTAQRVKTGQFVAPMIDIGALTGAELTTGWAMDNAVAAEIAARRVYQVLAVGKEMSLDTLNGIREGVNKDFLEKQGGWLKVHQATSNEQIRIERIVQQLSQGETIAGAEAALTGAVHILPCGCCGGGRGAYGAKPLPQSHPRFEARPLARAVGRVAPAPGRILVIGITMRN